MAKKDKIGIARQEFKRIRNLIKDDEIENSKGFYDFWEINSYKINTVAYGEGIEGPFQHQIRWHFDGFKDIQESVRDYLKKKSDESYFQASSHGTRKKVVIDFNDWSYKFNGKEYKSSEYTFLGYSDDEGNPLYLFDFSGIDLSGITLRFCIIKNCSFESAFFDLSYFDNVEFDCCLLDSASFYKATLSSVSLVAPTSINGIFLDAAWVEKLKKLNNDSLSFPFIYTEVKYWWIFRKQFKNSFIRKLVRADFTGQNHTTFVDINTDGLTLSRFKSQVDYIIWFQSLTAKMLGYKQLKRSSKISFSLSVFTTKYWSSFAALGISALIINLSYTLIYFVHAESYKNLFSPSALETFIKSFYYSTVTFMTLGYGDIFPKHWGGQLIVITEVTFGYIVLGLFVYLISRKVDKLY